jgi:ribosome-binding factor A
MPQFRRTDRINEQLRQEISILIRDEVRDPRIGMVTITAVKASPELDHARIFLTVMGDEKEQEETIEGLSKASPFIRGQLGRRLRMRRIPELHFEIDRMMAEATRIESLLREVRPAEDVPTDDEAAGDE